METKLTDKDKHILMDIYNELENITLPTTYGKGTYHANKIGVISQKDARQTCFGMVYYRGKKQESKYSKLYPHIMPLFTKFIESHYPSFKFNSVFVNKNTIAKKHLDSKNVGESLIVGLGPYDNGETTLYTSSGIKKYNIQTRSLIFNGSNTYHKSEPFTGTRYSLVFFN